MKKLKTIMIKNSIENTLSQRQRFNPYQTGHGTFINKKYDTKRIRGANKAMCRKCI